MSHRGQRLRADVRRGAVASEPDVARVAVDAHRVGEAGGERRGGHGGPGRYADATVWLRQAAEGDTDDARFAFVYGVALHDTGKTPRGCGSSKRPPAVIPATPRPGDGRLRSTRRAVRRFAE